MKRRVTALLCALLLALSSVLGLAGQAAAAQLSIYFTVVNETVLDLRSDTMPFNSGNEVYVPYTIFDSNTTGISLGVYATYNNNIAMIYSRAQGAVIFDLAKDTAESSLGAVFTKTAIRRNSVVFVPINLVCTYFGLEWNMLVDPDYGFIVRVQNSASRMTNQEFIPAAKNTISTRYNAYMRSLTGTPEPEPAESVTPAPPPEQTPTPSQPSSSRPPEPEGGDVYLAVQCGGGDTAPLAALMARYGASGLFFFRPEDLADRDREVRALAAAGHRIGLILDGETEQAREEQVRLGGELLGHILRTGTDIALASEDADPPEGWFSWRTTVDALPGERSASQQARETVQDTVGEAESFLLLDDSTRSAEALERILRDLDGSGCRFLLAVETVLDR